MTRVQVASPDAWAAVCSSAFVPLAVRTTSPRFAASLVQRRLTPDVALTRVASGASEVVRDHAVIAEAPRDSILLSLHRAGTGSVTQHGRTARLRIGSAVLYDTAAPYLLRFPAPMAEIVLQLPRTAIRHAGHRFADLAARPLPEGQGLRMLHALASAAVAEPTASLDFERDALAHALTEVALGVLDDARIASLRIDPAALLAGMRAYIRDRCADPVLTPAEVAASHHVSLRTAQQLFADDGDAIAARIRVERLRRARSALEAGALVQGAALGSGFRDVDAFARAFKRHFGMRPSDVRASDARS